MIDVRFKPRDELRYCDLKQGDLFIFIDPRTVASETNGQVCLKLEFGYTILKEACATEPQEPRLKIRIVKQKGVWEVE